MIYVIESKCCVKINIKLFLIKNSIKIIWKTKKIMKLQVRFLLKKEIVGMKPVGLWKLVSKNWFKKRDSGLMLKTTPK